MSSGFQPLLPLDEKTRYNILQSALAFCWDQSSESQIWIEPTPRCSITNLHSPRKRKESKRQKDNGNKKHILGYAQLSLSLSHAENYPPETFQSSTMLSSLQELTVKCSSCVAVEDTLVEVGSRFEEIIEEGGGGIHGDVRVGKAGSAVVVGGARDQVEGKVAFEDPPYIVIWKGRSISQYESSSSVSIGSPKSQRVGLGSRPLGAPVHTGEAVAALPLAVPAEVPAAVLALVPPKAAAADEEEAEDEANTLGDSVRNCVDRWIASVLFDVTRSCGHSTIARVDESSTLRVRIARSETRVDAITIGDSDNLKECTLAISLTLDTVYSTSGVCDGCTVHGRTCGRRATSRGSHWLGVVFDTCNLASRTRCKLDSVGARNFEVTGSVVSPTTATSSSVAFRHTSTEICRRALILAW
ncbi:hypothetical protein KCV07_g412, partial [Aureobasidium melanogenum]